MANLNTANDVEYECLAHIAVAMAEWLRWHKYSHPDEWPHVQRAFVYLVYGGSDYAFSRF